MKITFVSGHIPWNKGKHLSGMSGKHHSDETKQKMKENHKGMLGKHHSEESKIKLKESHLGLLCGEKNPMFGKHHSEGAKNKIRIANSGKSLLPETRRLISINKSGEKHQYYGKHLSPEMRKKMSEAKLGKTFSEEHKKRISQSLLGHKVSDEALRKMLSFENPNGVELYLDSLLQNYFPDEWKYVGDGNTIINGLCPDFINVNGQKKIIELFGEHWHKGENIPYKRTEEGRKKIFKEMGFETLIIWAGELKDEKIVIDKIMRFTHG